MEWSSKAIAGAALALLLCGLGTVARADAIPYPNAGTPNPESYSFTAGATGEIIAYFAGGGAAFDLQLGLLVNGVDTGVVGPDNKTSMIGQSLPLGHANAGDALIFVLNNTDGDIIKKAYSDPTMNVSYDIDGSRGHQHVYSTSYTATSLNSISVGTFVSWADQAFPNGDFSYNNLDVVLTNVSVSVPGSIARAGLPGLIVACGVLLASARRRRQKIA